MRPFRIAALALAALALWPPSAFAQESLILDVPPGTWSPLHAPYGLTRLRVLEGEVTLSGGGREIVHRAGDVWIAPPEDVYAAGNLTGTDARVAVTFLLRPDDPLATATVAPTEAPPRAQAWTGDANSLLP